MIVQSPNPRSQNEAIPAGLGKPSMGSKPPTPMGMPKPRPVRPPAQTGRMKPAYSPLGGMTNPFASAPRTAKNFSGGMPTPTPGAQGSVQAANSGLPTATTAIPTMEVDPRNVFVGFDEPVGYDANRTGPMQPNQGPLAPPPPMQSENDVGQQPFVPDRNFRNRESWDNWRRGRSYLTGGGQL